MKKQRMWKPGGRSRQKSNTKNWILKQSRGIDIKSGEEPEIPIVIPRHRRKEA
ncbi:hypothetical protein [Anaerocolumna xylanovorans]|uniref:Uncharacterized protein n=1 Tax=Anaerocolumna xylanovorans DSM 12503 TaxID=1121345 RepID=A0A1M7YNG1_9FIRM|nr:hypothetical protein [Anaerocolumna xylanovorans]SHO54139.1 hypothetical protein SAMN02745217_04594 [Anaerocolumna xylanovorans DSM 12503]